MSSFFRHGFSGHRPQISRPTGTNAPVTEISPTFAAAGWTQEVDRTTQQPSRPDPVPQQTSQAQQDSPSASSPRVVTPAAPRGPRFPYSPRLQTLMGRSGSAQNDASRSHISFAALRRSDSQDSSNGEARDRVAELSPTEEVTSPDVEKGFGRRMTGTTSMSGKSEFSFVQKSEGVSVSHLLPAASEAKHNKQNFWRATYGLCVIIGGWSFMVFACYLFKGLAVKYNLAASDATAEFILRHPTTQVQLFTVVGVFISEVCFILWGYSLSYFAIRRLAFGKERTELLTYAALAESKRAGYTLSRRKLAWPTATLLIWIGATFLAPAFATLLTPTSMSQFREVMWPEANLLNEAMAVYENLLTPGGTFDLTHLFTFANGSKVLGEPNAPICDSSIAYNTYTYQAGEPPVQLRGSADSCPQFSDVSTLISAGMAKLQRFSGFDNPVFKMINTTFVGGTGGVVPLGPNGAMINSDARLIPDSVARPQGYEYRYTVNQQGASAEVKCTDRPDQNPAYGLSGRIANVSVEWDAYLGSANISYLCGETPQYDVVFAGLGSVVPLLCDEFNLDAYMNDATDTAGWQDPDYSTLVLVNMAKQAQFGAGVATYLNRTSGGQYLTAPSQNDLSCTIRPYWSRRDVTYSSAADSFTVEDGPGSGVNYTTGNNRSLLVRPPLTKEERIDAILNGTVEYKELLWYTRRWLNQAARDAAQSVFSKSDAIGSPVVTPPDSGIPAEETFGPPPGYIYLPSQNNAMMHIWTFDLQQKPPGVEQTNIDLSIPHLEQFLIGVAEYAMTAQRQWLTYALADPDTHNLNNIADSTLNGTIGAVGLWNASTVGWGNGRQGNNDSSTVVYWSLTPILVFAALSFALVAWSHYYDRPNGTPYIAECDPIDFVDAVIASSQGGLQNSFHRDALLKEGGSLHGARAVKVRLGQIYRKDDPDGLPKLGFVDVN
ncbi:hypothetical protein CBOM_00175 [Ceraceosorus bombacis]|uniref:Uncharacterized protein n=1 Tax=Ceraceosorus bombacis TaxID=401625 RepID=A0A0P1B8C9_9BASI|nr:hypothetical protein CBOM_00175 [Ceraceosorus bombacis]